MQTHTSIIKSLTKTPMSLADLLNTTEVSLPTLRKAVQELSDKNWVQVVGQAETTGGRPAMLFGLDNHFYAMIGVHLQLPGMRLVVTDLNGNLIDEHVVVQERVPRPDEVIDIITEYAAEMQQKLPQREILGIGLAAPGYTDPISGDIISVGRVDGWQNFPICSRLQTTVGLPTKIANDVDSMAIAEMRYANLAFDGNLIYLGFDEGIKASITINGSIYTGPFGNAGLIATRLMAVNSPVQSDTLDGGLTVQNINKVFEQEMSKLSADERDVYASILKESDPRRRLQAIFINAKEDRPICIKILELVKQVVSVVSGNLIYIIQPDTLILGGVLSTMPATSFRQLEAEIRRHLPSLIANNIIIRPALLSSPNAAAIGAAHQFLQSLLLDMNKSGFDISV